MRRKDREVTELTGKLEIIKNSKVCRVAMSENNQPYIVPLNFGYEYRDDTLTLFFHGAHEGKKIDILKKNKNVCFEVDGEHKLIAGKTAAEYGFSFTSVIGFGTVEFIEDRQDKIHGLDMLMRHQADPDRKFDYTEAQLDGTEVFKITVSSFTGKRKPFPANPEA
jgi:nitroimidazol reductase NimA-like FMN-containing flavoprotein (pyridoxamine 5'-phosphate oxidase superfamily)